MDRDCFRFCLIRITVIGVKIREVTAKKDEECKIYEQCLHSQDLI